MSFELLPFADIKALLGAQGASIDSYPALPGIIARVLTAFEEYTGRLFEQLEREETVVIHGTMEYMIPLKALPIASVDSVLITSVSYGTETLTTADFDITNYGIRLGFGVKNCNVIVTYTGGLEAVTDALKNAALYQVAYEYQGKDQIGAENVSTEGGSVYRPPLGLLKETKRMLESSVHPLNMGAY